MPDPPRMLEFIRNILGPRLFVRSMRFWPPFWGTGIRISHVSADFGEIRVTMKQSALNTNTIGSHFGGSLYMMIDPFYMMILQHHLGPEYSVVDAEGKIAYLRRARGDVRSVIRVDPQELAEIRATLLDRDTMTRSIEIPIFAGDARVAVATKTVSIRKLHYISADAHAQ